MLVLLVNLFWSNPSVQQVQYDMQAFRCVASLEAILMATRLTLISLTACLLGWS